MMRPCASVVALGVLGVLAVLGSGCASSPSPKLTFAANFDDDDPDTHLTSLPRGEARPGDAVVRVIAHGVPCSGVLVGPKLVLTAHHCVAGRDGADVDEVLPPGWVFVELGGEPLPWGRVRARRIAPCDGWSGGAAYDIAAVVLEAPVPDVTPLTLGSVDEGAPVRAIGFGTGMTIREIPQTAWATWQSTRSTREGRVLGMDDAILAAEMGSHGGDSGGPILDASGEVVAIVSHGREGESRLTLGARIESCPAMLTGLDLR